MKRPSRRLVSIVKNTTSERRSVSVVSCHFDHRYISEQAFEKGSFRSISFPNWRRDRKSWRFTTRNMRTLIAPQNSVEWEIQKYLHRWGFVFKEGRLIFVRASIWGYITYFQYINQVSNPPRKVSTIVSGSRQQTRFILSQRLSSWPYSISVLCKNLIAI